MKKIILSLGLFMCIIESFSKDLFVEPLGLAPTYTTISAAIIDAEDGDNIFIDNGISNNPFNEDLTINKSVKLFNTVKDSFFTIDGNINLDFTNGDINVEIHGMNNDNGSIMVKGGEPDQRSEITLIDCIISKGNIIFGNKNLVSKIIGCKIVDGIIRMSYGSIIGCDISVVQDYENPMIDIIEASGELNDTIKIISNRITKLSTASEANAINIGSSKSNFIVSNNIISSNNVGVFVTDSAGLQNGFTNLIINNSIKSREVGIIVSAIESSCLIENNLLECIASTCPSPNIISSSRSTNVTYNIYGDNFGDVSVNFFALNANNNAISSFKIDTIQTPILAIDLANPSPIYYDLDLTVGDAGAFGGSFSIDQFFPLFEGKSKVFFVDAPRVIRQGDPVFIQAEAYDR